MNETYMTAEEVAVFLVIPINTLYRWRQTGYGPRAARMGRHLRYLRSDVVAWAESRRDDR